MPFSSFILRRASTDMRRSVLAVIVGYFTAVVIVVAGFALLGQIVPEFVPDSAKNGTITGYFLTVTLIINFLSAVAGGYATAFTVRYSDMWLAACLGLVMVFISALTMFLEGFVKTLWWYVALFILLIPCTVLGASIYGKRKIKFVS